MYSSQRQQVMEIVKAEEKQIDSILYNIYGLTADENLIVEQANK